MENIIPYSIFALGIVFTLLSWLSNRSISANDRRIERLEEKNEDLQNQIDRLIEERAERTERINRQLSDLDKDFVSKLNSIQLQLAKIVK